MATKKSAFLLAAVSYIFSSASAQVSPILQVRSYKLDNGFTVFLNEDPTAPKVFGAVMVNAGAKQESPDATGMAHYLEHLLFKGTQTMGTTDYALEKPHLDSIVMLYDQLATQTTPEGKAGIQQAINAQALKASVYGLPNEFDKLLRSIGGTEINAFTNYEMTFYHNSFPAHEMEKWLDLYASRFQNPVFRSFQSELEVVYEEKNRSMDNFTTKIFEKFQTMLFPTLPYGQWPVIGTVEHLKNPSLSKMYAFYNRHYVPGNMALILSGNFKSADVMPLIEKKFGGVKSVPYTPVEFPAPPAFVGIHTEYVKYTPIKVGLIGYQTAPKNDADRIALDICEHLLYNGAETGYLNRLQTNGEIMYCGAFPIVYNDAGGAFLFYVPKILSQSIEDAEQKVLGTFSLLRDGKFSDEELAAAKNNIIKSFEQNLENVEYRGIMIGEAFNSGITWEEHLRYPEKINNITRGDVVRVAQKYYGQNYVRLISNPGFPKNPKLEKPGYKAVVTEQKGQSAYAARFVTLPSLPFTPKFVRFDSDVRQASFGGGHRIYATQNPVNDLFYMEIRFRSGKFDNPMLETAAQFMNYCGAGKYNLDELKKAFGDIGCTYSVDCDDNYLSIHLEGKNGSFIPALELANLLVLDPKPGPKAKELLLSSTQTDRKLERRDPNSMGQAVYNYAMYGKQSPWLKRNTEAQIKAYTSEQLVAAFQNVARKYSADVLYTGRGNMADLSQEIPFRLALTKTPLADEFKANNAAVPDKNIIYFVNDKKAVQSQVYFYVSGNPFRPEHYADVMAFNEYFGGGFSGLVLQEIREYRSLAYATAGRYTVPPVPGKTARLTAFVGCQADKTVEAVEVMVSLIKDMPIKEERMADLKQALRVKAGNQFPEFRELCATVYNYQRSGYTEDPNRAAYEYFDGYSSEKLKSFYGQFIKGRPYVITIYGDKSRIRPEKLKALGEVVEISVKEIAVF